MSYLLDATNEDLRGAITAIGLPIQIGLWIRRSTDVTTGRCAVALGASSSYSTRNDSGEFLLNQQASEDRVNGRSQTTGGANNNAILSMADGTWSTTAGPKGDGWLPALLYWDGATGTSPLQTMTSRSIQINGSSAVENTVRTDLFNKWGYFVLGSDMAAGQDIGTDATATRVAEFAIWKTLLSAGEITSFEAGVIPSSINSSNLIWYGDLRADANKDAGSDALASLTVTGSTNDSSIHPVITSGLDPIRLIWRM